MKWKTTKTQKRKGKKSLSQIMTYAPYLLLSYVFLQYSKNIYVFLSTVLLE